MSVSAPSLARSTQPETLDPAWRDLYRVAGWAALIALAGALLDVVLSFVGGAPVHYGAMTAVDWFARLQGSLLMGLRDLGVLNILNMVMMIPVIAALAAAHRKSSPVFTAMAAALYLLAAAIYISNNPAIPMAVLGARHAAAATDAQRSLLAAAGEALLARGEDFTPGSLIGFLLSEAALIGLSIVMLRSAVFGKPTVIVGLLAFACLTFFTVWTTFTTAAYETVLMVFGAGGGILALAWYALIARRFLAA